MLAALALLLLAPDAAVQEAEAKARQALTQGNVAGALEHLEIALRAAEETATKLRLRDAYLEAGWTEPRGASLAELNRVAAHIRSERIRVWTTAAERFERDDQLHAAIILRRAVAELAGLPRAKQEMSKIRGIVRKLTENPSEEQKGVVADLTRTKKSGGALLKAGRKLLQQRQYRVVVRLCQELMFGDFDQEVQNGAQELRREAETRASRDVSTAEKEAAKKVLADERFHRLDLARSRHFLFLGPRAFIQALPEDERTRLDLAYIFQSDLAGQHLTFDGLRLCVYYQETFDFGGGLAGGKLIRIGNRAIRRPIAGMLHYHELGHCIFGRGWLHHGFTEGLADFAAGFTLDLLGQTRNAQHFITTARTQFVRFFLGRDVRYFDIQPYRPSAGFLFSFLPPGEAPFDWAPYRRVFHRMREAQFGSWPDRQHQLMRYFGYLMATEYGPETLDLLQEWGWPVSRADARQVPDEADGLLMAAKRGDFLMGRGEAAAAAEHYRTVLRRAPRGALAPRACYGLLRVALAQGDGARAQGLRQKLGIVDDYLLLGPYHARKRTAHVVLPPETHVDLKQPVRFGIETARWKKAKVRPTGQVDLRQQGFGYPEHACAFALTYVHVDGALPARVWVGSDDGHTLYVNGELQEKRPTTRTFTFDDDFADVRLRAGWNRILLKVHNTTGTWGFLMRVTGRDGEPLPGRFSTGDLEDRVARFAPPRTKAVSIVADEFKGLKSSRWLPTVGGFDTQNGRLRPRDTAKLGLWQRFKVDPDKPKDGPANILWLRAPDLVRADSFALELVVAAGAKDGLPAKFGLTVDGENENDGQSGHTFVLDAHEEKLRCHWYRYDRLLYLHQGVAVKPAEQYRVRLTRHARKWWLTVNDAALFEGVDAPRLPAFGFGLLTWGKTPEFESIKLSRLTPSR
ncbi:MAG: hypothetical protein ACYTEZ_02050 [Planctomycetota bacterium]